MSSAPALYRADQVRALDQSSIAALGIDAYALMRRAGEAAFAALLARWPNARRVVVLCGGGNNGGDGYVIAAIAAAAELDVTLFALAAPDTLRGAAADAQRDAAAAGLSARPFSVDALHAAAPDVIVDALLGTGLNRPPAPDWAAAIDAVNAAAAGVLAVDLPSGLDADRGVLPGAAVRADLSVCFIGRKLGLYTGAGPACAGEIAFVELGTPSAVYQSQTPPALLERGDDIAQLLAPRPRDAHKGDHGHVLVVGGNRGMGGAARLCGEAAARIGAGLISVATHAAHAAALTAQRPELMTHAIAADMIHDTDASASADTSPLAFAARASVLALGPGLGRDGWSQTLYRAARRLSLPTVIDADALNLLAADANSTDTKTDTDASAAAALRAEHILTPHPGEAARLLATDVATIQHDRVAAALAISRRYGGVCVLKGAGSVIAEYADGAGQQSRVHICAAGNPGMASGGMGDVLTGVIAALWAQRLTRYDAARIGAYVHAHAADLAAADGGERGLLASDLFAYLRTVCNP